MPSDWSISGQSSRPPSWLNTISVWGGDRAGRMAGGSVGSPTCRNTRSITGGSSTKAMIRMGWPQLESLRDPAFGDEGHCRGKHS